MLRRHQNYRSLRHSLSFSLSWSVSPLSLRSEREQMLRWGPLLWWEKMLWWEQMLVDLIPFEESTGTWNPRAVPWTDKCSLLRCTLSRHRRRRSLRRELHSIRKGPKMQHGRCFGKFQRWVHRRRRNIRSRTCWDRHRLNLYIAYVQIRRAKKTQSQNSPTDGK